MHNNTTHLMQAQMKVSLSTPTIGPPTMINLAITVIAPIEPVLAHDLPTVTALPPVSSEPGNSSLAIDSGQVIGSSISCVEGLRFLNVKLLESKGHAAGTYGFFHLQNMSITAKIVHPGYEALHLLKSVRKCTTICCCFLPYDIIVSRNFCGFANVTSNQFDILFLEGCKCFFLWILGESGSTSKPTNTHQTSKGHLDLKGLWILPFALQSVHDLPDGLGQTIFNATTAIVVLTVYVDRTTTMSTDERKIENQFGFFNKLLNPAMALLIKRNNEQCRDTFDHELYLGTRGSLILSTVRVVGYRGTLKCSLLSAFLILLSRFVLGNVSNSSHADSGYLVLIFLLHYLETARFRQVWDEAAKNTAYLKMTIYHSTDMALCYHISRVIWLFATDMSEVTDVHGRTFGVWTLLTCTLCFLCAFNLENKPLYENSYYNLRSISARSMGVQPPGPLRSPTICHGSPSQSRDVSRTFGRIIPGESESRSRAVGDVAKPEQD
ncbi:hypothetical protein IFM89_007233 [Coptis chinensis]|uniref:Uncharacterized protein n=1 Tax=Coptis chinensis TaxID=261450 RepID=A0A835IKF5_9MAGN|nr:hypothetical protein IFM89_007233 [Coptis chinensis]